MKKKPDQVLAGKKIAFFRAEDQSDYLKETFAETGAEVKNIPLININPAERSGDMDYAVKNLESFDGVIFTSVYAVRFFKLLLMLEGMLSVPEQLLVIAIGKRTAFECHQVGFHVSMSPASVETNGIIEMLKSKNLIEGRKYLFPSSSLSKETLAQELAALGGMVHRFAVYHNTPLVGAERKPVIEAFTKFSPDVVVFTSPSTFANFLEVFEAKDRERFFRPYKVIAMGNTTRDVVKHRVAQYVYIPEESTIEGIKKLLFSIYTHKEVI